MPVLSHGNLSHQAGGTKFPDKLFRLMDASLEENSSDSTAFTPSSSIKENFSASSPMMAGGTLSGLTRASG